MTGHAFTCQQCSQPFTAKQPTRKYCSKRCAGLAFRASQPTKPDDLIQLEKLTRQYPAEAAAYLAKLNSRNRRHTPRNRAGVVGPQWEAARAKVKARKEPCWICGGAIDWDARPRTPHSFSVDHMQPRSKGGDYYSLTNLATAHYGCNSSRGNGTKRMRRRSTPPPQPPVPDTERW